MNSLNNVKEKPTELEMLRRTETIREGEDFTNQVDHEKILDEILNQAQPEELRELAERYSLNKGTAKLKRDDFLNITVKYAKEIAANNGWALCRHNESIYIYNGGYWSKLDEAELKTCLGDVALTIGIEPTIAENFRFGDDLIKQFYYKSHLKAPNQTGKPVLVNVDNGTLEINPRSDNMVLLRSTNRNDFLRYQLPFKYTSGAKAPKFKKYLDEVLPDPKLQMVLAEYMGYIFVKTEQLKLEKVLLLFGTGHNGKSVFFDIQAALLGDKNMSSYSLEGLTKDQNYERAMIADKLINYGSDISTKIDTAVFKQLASGEPVQARLPYEKPHEMRNYAKLMFNANELPTGVEHTDAFFRRFLIIPFEQKITEQQKDPQLANKIIDDELSGVFNWVLEGLKRLLKQGDFTKSDIIDEQTRQYRIESDSVQMFIAESGYEQSAVSHTTLKTLYGEYKAYCEGDGYYPVGKRKLSKRLQNAGFKKVHKTAGTSFELKKEGGSDVPF